ncbi:helix-turn-helix transcriptional regulator [Butyrivibrio sp.]|uniref:helix-turn-helix transcriptional regulator n=1 Tax=Butyrivibrio sp. TaxID=28121 RepID=UPI0025C738EA|nr:helix-turn-helix transcriptional regulator [Butyrivibrio sp.]MBQ9304090.1 helix-turn-helix transcriptional regulator [Butyrivibrio sp.]
MKKMSLDLLADTIRSRRDQKGMTQDLLSEKTGINRVMIGKIENKAYVPSIVQLEKLCEILDFEITDVLVERRPMYYSAFRGTNVSAVDQEGIDYLLKMMMASKQQLLMRRVLKKDE